VRRLLVPLLLAALTSVHAEELQIPDNFFRAMPQPNGPAQLIWTCPGELDEKSVTADMGWWNACAKITLLMEADKEFGAAFNAAVHDPDLAKIDISYVDWSRAKPDQKIALRKRAQDALQPIIQRHRLIELLSAATIDPVLIAKRRGQDQQALAERLGVANPTPTTLNLLHYCPGVSGNVSINTQHPLAPKLESALEKPSVAEQYRSALTAFGKYLDKNPTATVEQRDAELSSLMAPVLDQVR